METSTAAGNGTTGILKIASARRFSLLDLVLALIVIGVLGRYYVWQFEKQVFAAAVKNDLPKVQLGELTAISDKDAYKQAYDFSKDWYTYNIAIWEKALAPYRGKPGVQYLEVGLYEGRSAIWMLEHILTDPTSHLTGIDPFLGPYKDRYAANLKKSGASERATTITGFSQDELRKLPLNSYDIIYIDGSHAKDDVLEDAVLSVRLLKEGGVLILDDYQWVGGINGASIDAIDDMTKDAIDSFIHCFERQLEVIHNGYQIILKKKPAARRGVD